jgi:hypothetical protein
VKKAELKAGVAYYATSQNNHMNTYQDAIYKTHKQHERNRFYVIFDTDGQPKTSYRSASVIYMTNCPTYGHDCLRHKKEDSTVINCYRTDFRLMDIRDEYWSVIKRMHEARKAQPTKDIRAERLRRIAKRNQESQEKPIRAEFFSVLSQITDSYCTSYDRLGGFTPEQMQKITDAIKASMPSVMAVAS